MNEQPQGFTGALEGATSQLETLQGIINERMLEAIRQAGIAVEEFLEWRDEDEEEREYEAARRRENFIYRKRKKQRRAKLGY